MSEADENQYELETKLLEAESARDALYDEDQKCVKKVKGSYVKKFKEVQNLKTELSSEQEIAQELCQDLDTSKVSLASVQIQLETAKQNLSSSDNALEEARTGSERVREVNEKERGAVMETMRQLLVRIGALMQQMGRARGRPFRTFFMILFDNVLGRARPVLVWVGRLMQWRWTGT
ncbi:uncharacterized protein PAC_06341 [Phialocephala subalpina]|uniref:Uncharacterized protein n=1 Tax=Phialocephala subalpina TaxID=576137 RepID=A0A1L7WUQ6_9HELO|nr:uncharacterized protein PAC_06341 [Phialocephala subalpina]